MRIKTIVIAGGLSLIVITLIISVILLGAQHLYSLSFGDLFSLGQFLVELILIPTVIVGFIIAIAEFRASLHKAQLSLYWEPKTDKFEKFVELNISSGNTRESTPRIVIRNSGRAVTNWYLIRLEIPRELYFEHEPKINRLIGNISIPINTDTHWHRDARPENIIFEFMSNGEYASYPSHPQPICALNLAFLSKNEYPEVCKLPYTIFSNQGNKNCGELSIKIRRKV